MSIDWLREFCLSLPHTTEQVQWEDSLVFKVGGKMYAVASLEPRAHWLSFKASEEDFSELIERPGMIPAPYLARAHWVALETESNCSRAELQQLLARAHSLIFAKLPRKTQQSLSARKPASKPRPGKTKANPKSA
ncbi:MAG: MmcQ/YjbR family DNA-binding protein [Candidatus Acidiferrales bacterium]